MMTVLLVCYPSSRTFFHFRKSRLRIGNERVRVLSKLATYNANGVSQAKLSVDIRSPKFKPVTFS